MHASDATSSSLDPHEAAIRHDADCDLCKAERFTHWYFEDDLCWIADCEVCSVPMVVWKPHGTDPSETDAAKMLESLHMIAAERFGPDAFSLDTNMRQIPEHWHAHARDADWFSQRASRPMSRYTTVGGERIERPMPGAKPT